MNGVKISDHQQSMATRPLRGAFLKPPALLVVADLNLLKKRIFFDDRILSAIFCMKNQPIINRSLIRTQVYDYLRQQMTNGNMQPGSIIEAKKLMNDLGVSQTPLREAFLQLQADGFVTIMPQRGVKINALNWEDIKEIYEIIGGLESRVIISVFDRIGDAETSNSTMYISICATTSASST